LSEGARPPAPPSRRLDQWLWFSRLVRTRSLAARLCTVGAVAINGIAIHKSNHAIRIGDIIAAPQGAYRRTVRVLGLGVRRGPASEARLLYEELGAPLRLSDRALAWEPLLSGDEPES
jgi:ribosome-associated heat shock protein Hsp15